MNKPENPRKALGKGMGALLPTRTHTPPRRAGTRRAGRASRIDAERSDRRHRPNPLQPRRVFQNDRLEELAQSIRANGIIQPLVVRVRRRPLPTGGRGATVARRQTRRGRRQSRSWSGKSRTTACSKSR